MYRLVMLAIALVAVWLIWSGLYKPLIIGLGVLSVALTLWLSVRMDLTNRAFFALDLVPRLLGFWAWLLVEIIRSNFKVAAIILSPRLPISPVMVKMLPPTQGIVGQATLANSITLTPGTLTVDAHEGEFIVHCLTEAGARETVDGDMGQRLVRAVGER